MTSRWSAVVYARTQRSDTWWRAVPAALDQEGWLGDVVRSVYASANQLEQPRFLLARLHGHWVSGIACRAELLSPDMNRDEGHRALYTFVGWAAPEGDPVPPPSLSELRAGIESWVAQTYREWVGPDWDASPAALRDHRTSGQGQPPWVEAARSRPPLAVTPHVAGQPVGTVPLDRQPGMLTLYPAAQAKKVWDRGLVTDIPFVLATGWASARTQPFKGLTFACVEDVDHERNVAAVTPAAPEPQAPPHPTSAPSDSGRRPGKAAGSRTSPPLWSRGLDRLNSVITQFATGFAYRVQLYATDERSAVLVIPIDDRGRFNLPGREVTPGESIENAYRQLAAAYPVLPLEDDPHLLLIDRFRATGVERLTFVYACKVRSAEQSSNPGSPGVQVIALTDPLLQRSAYLVRDLKLLEKVRQDGRTQLREGPRDDHPPSGSPG